MKKSYTTTIKWNVVNMRKKDKCLPKNNTTILYLSETEVLKPSINFATVHDMGEYMYIHNGIYKLPVSTGLKWCYAYDITVDEKEE